MFLADQIRFVPRFLCIILHSLHHLHCQDFLGLLQRWSSPTACCWKHHTSRQGCYVYDDVQCNMKFSRMAKKLNRNFFFVASNFYPHKAVTGEAPGQVLFYAQSQNSFRGALACLTCLLFGHTLMYKYNDWYNSTPRDVQWLDNFLDPSLDFCFSVLTFTLFMELLGVPQSSWWRFCNNTDSTKTWTLYW